MHIHITPRHLALTPALRTFAAHKIDALNDRRHDLLAAHVILHVEHGAMSSRRFRASVRLAVSGPDIRASEHNPDLYAAIDKVVDKLARRLRKRKTRLQTRHKHRTRVATFAHA